MKSQEGKLIWLIREGCGIWVRTAVREGYFKIPRQIPLAELADKHEMSDTEASEIMRRGLDNVVRCAVLDEHSCS